MTSRRPCSRSCTAFPLSTRARISVRGRLIIDTESAKSQYFREISSFWGHVLVFEKRFAANCADKYWGPIQKWVGTKEAGVPQMELLDKRAGIEDRGEGENRLVL